MTDELPTRGFEALYAVLTLVFLAGIHLDSRSHVHDTPEAFVTLEHGIFYAAAAGLVLLLAGAAWSRRRPGSPWRTAIPQGYGWAAVGLVLFGAAGVGDMAWHAAFGIEADVEALVSPTHLLLAAGAFLFASAPLRSALLRRRPPQGWASQLPAAVGGLGALGVLSFMVQFLHPVTQAVPAPDYHGYLGPGGGLAGWIVAPALVAATALVLADGLPLRPGLVTLVLAADGLLLGLVHERWPLALSMAAAGLAAESLARVPGTSSPAGARTVGAGAGLAMGLVYFGVLAATGGVTWNVHLAAGAVALAAASGTLAGLGLTLDLPAGGPRPGGP